MERHAIVPGRQGNGGPVATPAPRCLAVSPVASTEEHVIRGCLSKDSHTDRTPYGRHPGSVVHSCLRQGRGVDAHQHRICVGLALCVALGSMLRSWRDRVAGASSRRGCERSCAQLARGGKAIPIMIDTSFRHCAFRRHRRDGHTSAAMMCLARRTQCTARQVVWRRVVLVAAAMALAGCASVLTTPDARLTDVGVPATWSNGTAAPAAASLAG